MKELLAYIEKLKTGSFECWSEDQKDAYLTACISIEEKAKELSNPVIFIKNELYALEANNTFFYKEDLSIETIQDILAELSGQDVYINNFNGVDQDWSISLYIGERRYLVWGSAYSGSFGFRYNP